MEIKAWHSTHEHFGLVGYDSNYPIILNKTHKLIPAILYRDDSYSSKLELCEAAFNFFNWVHSNFTAPSEVNSFCRDNETHASMSVGDIVQINDTYWLCKSFSFQEITNEVQHGYC
jgi:hypothetical protein